jgi:hypothetical protein
MDDRILPELEDEPEGPAARRHSRGFHDALYQWLEVAPGRIVNRAEPQGSNGSKPYQAQLIVRYGLRAPETLITNDPEAVLAFQRQHGTLIYKSMSGVRSIVRALGEGDLERLDLIRWCPVQFQACVPGIDMRVHIVDRDVHATEIVSDILDYRYAQRSGGSARLRPAELPADIADRCVRLARGLGPSLSRESISRSLPTARSSASRSTLVPRSPSTKPIPASRLRAASPAILPACSAMPADVGCRRATDRSRANGASDRAARRRR